MAPSRTTASVRPAAALVAAAVTGTLIGLAVTAAVPIAGVAEPDAVVRFGLPVVRVLLTVSAVATVGLSLLPILVGYDRPARAEPVLAVARRLAAASSLVWAVCALVTLVLQTEEVRPGNGVSPSAVIAYVEEVGAGKALVFVAGLALVSFALGLGAIRAGEGVPAELRAAVAMFGLLPLPVTGHATNFRWHDFTMVSLELHVLGAAAWTGGLGALVVLVAANRSLLATALPRFSRLATVCLAVVAVTGLFNGFVELDGPSGLVDTLFGTGYGALVLLKLSCLCLLAAAGANIRWRLLPAIVRQRPTALVTWAGLELAVMGLAIGFAVVLSRAPVS
ncbi:copper resistance protein CopD [Actinophytocola xinjiangensis]|uniref:Copper resistance protein CopD n=1 Tax=Actinophytocola xinjiangensis TaxID=485602 RepID=A0A7Z0WFT3_9PSEU|nr:CopD family protein [Actinophytocola xinjiangensis]OLF06318.1 copper resistance protein CopD [Actinophytocola xinjiangensis]